MFSHITRLYLQTVNVLSHAYFDIYFPYLFLSLCRSLSLISFFSFLSLSHTAVGLYQSEVKGHILLFINRGSGDYKVLWPQNLLGR